MKLQLVHCKFLRNKIHMGIEAYDGIASMLLLFELDVHLMSWSLGSRYEENWKREI